MIHSASLQSRNAATVAAQMGSVYARLEIQQAVRFRPEYWHQACLGAPCSDLRIQALVMKSSRIVTPTTHQNAHSVVEV
jgi:hypothetical protein